MAQNKQTTISLVSNRLIFEPQEEPNTYSVRRMDGMAFDVYVNGVLAQERSHFLYDGIEYVILIIEDARALVERVSLIDSGADKTTDRCYLLKIKDKFGNMVDILKNVRLTAKKGEKSGSIIAYTELDCSGGGIIMGYPLNFYKMVGPNNIAKLCVGDLITLVESFDPEFVYRVIEITNATLALMIYHTGFGGTK